MQATKKEKIFAKHIFNEELISKIFKELIQLKTKKKQKTNPQKNPSDPILKWPKNPSSHLSYEDIHMASGYMILNIINHQGSSNQIYMCDWVTMLYSRN